MNGHIRVGTASWADPGFIADWYPAGLPALQRLPYYSNHFNLVELNSSFYAVPERSLVQRWCDQTPPGFTFDVKLHRLLSRHSTGLSNLPPSLRSLAELQGDKVRLTPALETALTKEMLEAVRPLGDTGKLGVFLLQLTPGFSPFKHKLTELDNVLELLAPFQIAVELRNRNWVTNDQLEETVAFFRRRNVPLVSVDAPEGEHFAVMPDLDVVTTPKVAYLRLHGRNLKGYVTGKTVAERFDYLYSDQELTEIAARTRRLAEQAAVTHVIYNNNHSDYAIQNAAAFQRMLSSEHPEVLPAPGLSPAPGQTAEFDFAPPRRRQH